MAQFEPVTFNGSNTLGTFYTSTAPVFVSSGASVNVYPTPAPPRKPTSLEWLVEEVDAVCELAR